MTSVAGSYQEALQLWEQAAQSLAASGQITQAQLTKALAAAPIMAAIAGAESGFGANPVGDQGTSFGWWQIHVPAHPQYDSQSLLDSPFYNAAAAVQIYLSSGFGAWTTYSYRNGPSGLTYVGPGQGDFLQFMQGAAASIGSAGGSWAPPSQRGGGSTPIPPAGPWSASTQHLVATIAVVVLAFALWASIRS